MGMFMTFMHRGQAASHWRLLCHLSRLSISDQILRNVDSGVSMIRSHLVLKMPKHFRARFNLRNKEPECASESRVINVGTIGAWCELYLHKSNNIDMHLILWDVTAYKCIYIVIYLYLSTYVVRTCIYIYMYVCMYIHINTNICVCICSRCSSKESSASDFLQRPARIPSSWSCCAPRIKGFYLWWGGKTSKKSTKMDWIGW